MEEFKTISESRLQEELAQKKSKFIANLFYVESSKEAETIIKEQKKKYYDARHNCFAYRVIEDGKIVDKQSDDGEPSGTAGAPMLSILQKNELVNVLIIVTRYFGGILLGTGGLVRAYSGSLKKILEKSKFVIKQLAMECRVEIEYNEFDKFKYYCNSNDIVIQKTDYFDKIICIIYVAKEKLQKIEEDIAIKEISVIHFEKLRKKYINKNK